TGLCSGDVASTTLYIVSTNIQVTAQIYSAGNPIWQYGPPQLSGNMKDGVIYSVYVYAKDNAVPANTENFGTTPNLSFSTCTIAFVYDLTRPTATVTFPGNAISTDTVPAF